MEKYLKNKNIFQHITVSTDVIPFSQSVADACRANRCGKYGTCWTCPPGVGDFREWEKRIKSYKNATVFTCKYDLEDSFDFDGMMAGGEQTQKVLLSIVDQLQEDGVDFLALGCEGCALCEKCTYPDAPCRFPKKATPSVEACGINVVELSRNIGVNYNNGPNTVTYFCVLLTR